MAEREAFDAVAYKNAFTKEKYDRVSLVLLGKGRKEELQAHVKKYGYKSLNDWINIAIREKIERDTAADPVAAAQVDVNNSDGTITD